MRFVVLESASLYCGMSIDKQLILCGFFWLVLYSAWLECLIVLRWSLIISGKKTKQFSSISTYEINRSWSLLRFNGLIFLFCRQEHPFFGFVHTVFLFLPFVISVCQETISKNFEWKKVIWQLPFLQIIKHFLFWLEFKQIIGNYYDQKKMLCLVSSLKNTDLNHYRFWTSNDVIRQINHLDISVFNKRKKALLVDIWQKNDDAKHLANEVNPFMHLKIGLVRLHQQEKQNLSKFHFENQIFRLLQVFRFTIETIFGISIIIHGMFFICRENCNWNIQWI